MSDIDFDELDRAVNNLMNQRNGVKTDQPATEPVIASEPKPAKSVQEAAVKPAEPVTAPAPIATSAPISTSPTPVAEAVKPPEAPAVRRPTGRFMDVVRPSSDMRAAPAMRDNSTIRETLPVQETSPVQEIPATQPVPEEKLAEPIVAEDLIMPEPVEETLATESVDETPPEAKTPVTAMPTEPVVDEIVLEEIQPEVAPTPEPMQSPFLDNVAVDKRPLGSMIAEEAPKEPEQEPAGDILEPIDETKTDAEDDTRMMDARSRRTVIQPLTPIEPTEHTEATLPGAETDPRENLNQPDLDASFGDISEADLPVELFVDESELITDEDQPAEKEAAPVDEEPLAPGDIDAQIMALESDDAAARQAAIPSTGDIPKQYAEHATEGPEPSAVFDVASEAPEPLQHAEKKKSGLAVVLWILLLIIIGAGGGVAVWYFLLQ